MLQGYDEYVIAYTESRSMINLAGLPVGAPNENTLVHPVVVDSQLVGYWRRFVERHGIVAQPTPATGLTAAQRRAVEVAFTRYADFAGAPVLVAWPVANPPDDTTRSASG